VVLLWGKDDLVIEGTGNRRTFTGRTAKHLLPDLIPLLDGSRTCEELATRLGWGPEPIRTVLMLLYSCGLLQEGPAEPELARTPQYALLARLLDTTRVNQSATQAQQRLDAAVVGIHGPSDVTDEVVRHLAAVGIRVFAVSQDEVGGADRAALDLAVIVIDGDGTVDEELAAYLHEQRIPVLLVGTSGRRIFVGPYAAPDFGGCACCAAAGLGENADPDQGTPSGRAILAGLTTVEVVTLLSRVGVSTSLRGRVDIDLERGPQGIHPVIPRPGCPICGRAGVPLQEPPLAYAYESSVAFPPRRLVNPRDHQAHFESSNVVLQFDTKDFPGCPVTDLPHGDAAAVVRGLDHYRHVGLTVHGLEAVLGATFGRKEEADPTAKLKRFAPTGGNLGSPQGYLVVRDVDGLEPGCYAYLGETHQLAQLSRGLPQAYADGAPVELVLTGAIARVGRKYRTFAYRVVHLDAGVALAHVALAAARVGVVVHAAQGWPDEELADLLGLDLDQEAVTAHLRLIGAGS
jgi:bacteriocin biosynthesis cyclodehydratase domain-containing protein